MSIGTGEPSLTPFNQSLVEIGNVLLELATESQRTAKLSIEVTLSSTTATDILDSTYSEDGRNGIRGCIAEERNHGGHQSLHGM